MATLNLDREAETAARFWRQARRQLAGLPAGGVNLGHEAVGRHAHDAAGRRTALSWWGRDGSRRQYTYGDLDRLSNRFANVLQGLGVQPGEAVFTLLGRLPELWVTALGTFKNRSIYCPLFAAFGPEPVRVRMEIGRARVLVTTPLLYRRKVAEIADRLPDLEHVLLVGLPDDAPTESRALSFTRLLARAEERFEVAATDPEETALLHFTSGTTGRPKGALHVHEAVCAHRATAGLALGLRAGDSYWCTADPGWVTGTSYGIIAPLAVGARLVVDEEEFDGERWCQILAEERVNVLYTAPTALRLLRKLGIEPAARADLTALRHVASVGEALDAETVEWCRGALGRPAHDTWWQTETGAIMIANLPGEEPQPGSMGRALPGTVATVVEHRPDGGLEPVAEGEVGELALHTGWPSRFRGYLADEERTRRCFRGGLYLTSDRVRRDARGQFWFIGRSDDMISSAGHLIGPFEVESALLEHPAVAEAAAVGKPDPLVGEMVKAFVCLRQGRKADDALHRELLAHVRKRLGPAVAPREIEFSAQLPKTRSGKVLRRRLRAPDADAELGREEE